ncbi:MAG: hypothetical protein J1F23_03190 [Oscillospiraceae bacterium]|nr:hypothetical protein [Oscillospiraceae bacterium]
MKIKNAPQKPFLYFLKLYWIYYLIYLAAIFMIQLPRMISVSAFSFAGIGSIWEFPIFSFIELVGNVFIEILPAVGCVVLCKHVLGTTDFTGELSKYKFIWYLLPLWVMRPFNYLVSQIDTPTDISSDDFFVFYLLRLVLSVVVSSVLEVLASLLYAAVLTAVASGTQEKRDKTLNIMCVCAIVSQILYLVIYLFIPFNNIPVFEHVFNWAMIKSAICIVIPAGLLLKSKFTPKLERIWCTAVPLAYFAASAAFVIADHFLP